MPVSGDQEGAQEDWVLRSPEALSIQYTDTGKTDGESNQSLSLVAKTLL